MKDIIKISSDSGYKYMLNTTDNIEHRGLAIVTNNNFIVDYADLERRLDNLTLDVDNNENFIVGAFLVTKALANQQLKGDVIQTIPFRTIKVLQEITFDNIIDFIWVIRVNSRNKLDGFNNFTSVLLRKVTEANLVSLSDNLNYYEQIGQQNEKQVVFNEVLPFINNINKISASIVSTQLDSGKLIVETNYDALMEVFKFCVQNKSEGELIKLHTVLMGAVGLCIANQC